MVSRFDRRSVLLGGAAAAAGVAGAGALGLGFGDIAGATTNGPLSCRTWRNSASPRRAEGIGGGATLRRGIAGPPKPGFFRSLVTEERSCALLIAVQSSQRLPNCSAVRLQADNY